MGDKMFRRALLSMAGIAAMAAGASAADLAPAPDTSGWTFDFEPYVWLAGINGDVGAYVNPLNRKVTGEIDESISDVLQSFDIGLMGLAQARNGRFSVAADIFWVKLSSDGSFDGDRFDVNGDLTTENLMLTGVVGYSFIQEDGYNLDFVAGARLWSVQNQVDINGDVTLGPITVPFEGQATQTETWVDPLVGLKGSALISDSNFFVNGWALVGGFGVSSEIMWDVYGAVGYQFTDSFSSTLGFRALGVDYRNNDFTYDITQYGPQLGFLFRF
jgi:hypothetical protein